MFHWMQSDFQNTVFDFVKLVKENSLDSPCGTELMNKFCKFVTDREVWHLAQMVVPRFDHREKSSINLRKRCHLFYIITLHLGSRSRLSERDILAYD